MLIWQLILIQIVTFALIIIFLRWLLYSHISRALKRLQQLNQQNLEKEKALKEELERAKREAARQIEEGKKEAEILKGQAKEEAEKVREEMVAQARKEAKRLINEATRECQRKMTELTLEMQEKAIYLARDMIRYIFTDKGQQDLHARLIDELIGEIKGLEKEKLRAQGKQAELICAYPLSDDQKKNLKTVLTSKLNRDISLTEKIDPEIIAGLIVRLGGFVIDGSIRNKFKKILPLIREKAKEVHSR